MEKIDFLHNPSLLSLIIREQVKKKAMRLFPILFLLICLSSCKEQQTDNPVPTFPEAGKWIDLTYNFDENTIFWPTAEKFVLDTVFEGQTDGGYYYAAYQFCSAEHGGTHLDAPVHFAEGKHAVEEIPLDRLIGAAIVVDISEKALANPDYQLSVEDLQNWEQQNGQIPDDAILLMHSGFGQFWPDPIKYLGTDKRGEEGVANLHFPAIHPDAAQWLVDNRKIKAVGVDTPSIDYGQSKTFRSHQILYEQNIPGFENIANLDQLPVKGAHIIALPMKIKGGSGGPLRMVAWVGE